MTSRLILASKSPRRSELLKQMGLELEVVHSGIEEENSVEIKSPREHVIRWSEEKAREVAKGYPQSWVLGADTIVSVDGLILGKPKTPDEAQRMLSLLSGKEHCVLTGMTVLHLERGKKAQEVVETLVRVKALAPEEMAWYIQTGEPFDKAGAYAIQGKGAFMVESIRGSYTNVVGLPICELMEMLKRLGALRISASGMQISE